MGSSKTPRRATLKAMLGWGGKGDDSGHEGQAGGMAEATVDIGALMRKKKQMLLIPSGGISNGSLASSRSQQGGQPGLGAAPFGGKLGHAGMAENPIYSPDDSLAKAASKLHSLKALRATMTRPLGTLPAPKAEPAAALPTPTPHPCESPHLQEACQRHAVLAADVAEGEQLSGENSGELAALQKRSKSVHAGAGGSVHKQRDGIFWQGDNQELERTLHEYNHAASVAASPRMTRARRRKSVAVGQSLQLEPGLAKSVLKEKEELEEEGEQQQQQQGKRAAGSCKVMAGGLLHVPQSHPEPQQPQQPQQLGTVANEVAALNAEICGQLEGFIEESPEKGPRGDGRSLREKLLESWDGKTYYERLLEMSREKEVAVVAEEQERHMEQVHKAALQSAKPTSRTPAGKTGCATSRTAAVPPAAAAQAMPAQPAQQVPGARPAPLPMQVLAVDSSNAAAAKVALLTPNSQRHKLSDLTHSLQLLRVSTRHRQVAAASDGAAAAPRAVAAARSKAGEPPSSPPLAQDAMPVAPEAAASRPPRARSSTPDAEIPPGGKESVGPGSWRASTSAEPVAPKLGGRRGTRRGTTPPAKEASGVAGPQQGAGAGAVPAAVSVAATAMLVPGPDTLHTELAATYEMLNAALAEKEALAEELRGAEVEAAAERKARVVAERELERVHGELVAAAQEQQEQAAALKAAEQRSRQLAKELAEVQQSTAVAAAAAADRAGDIEARWGEAEKVLNAILKAANGGLKTAATGKEEARLLAEARRENTAGAAPNSARQLRQSGGGRQWR